MSYKCHAFRKTKKQQDLKVVSFIIGSCADGTMVLRSPAERIFGSSILPPRLYKIQQVFSNKEFLMNEITCGVCECEDIEVFEGQGLIFYKCSLCSHKWGKHDIREK